MRNFSIILIIAIIAFNGSAQKPADIMATKQTVQLFNRILKIQNKGIMIGHQDDYVYGHSWKSTGVSDVKQVTGEFPAVFGWELADYELGHSKSIDSVAFDEIINGIAAVHEMGGINTISWHCNNALTGGNAWDVSSKLVVKSVLPGGEKNAEFVKMLDKMVQFFLLLKDKNGESIPVIFRPYHEHTGSWFWWGQNLCTKEDYISLWKFTVDYFKNKGVHNILYAYSSSSGLKNEAQYTERYPGDDIVDLVGFDEYQGKVIGKGNYIKSLKNMLGIIIPYAKKHNKIPIIAETGLEGIPDAKWWTEILWGTIKDYPIAYVLFWRNACDKPGHYYVPFPGQESEANFKEFYTLPRTLFLGDIKVIY